MISHLFFRHWFNETRAFSRNNGSTWKNLDVIAYLFEDENCEWKPSSPKVSTKYQKMVNRHIMQTMPLSDEIKAYRKKNGISQQELADELFVTRSAVAKWEQGLSVPNKTTLAILSKMLHKKIDDLLLEEETPKKSPKPYLEIAMISTLVIGLSAVMVCAFVLPSNNDDVFMKNSFFQDELLNEAKISSLPSPKEESIKGSIGNNLYLDLSKDDFLAYVDSVYPYLRNNESIYSLSFEENDPTQNHTFAGCYLFPIQEKNEALTAYDQSSISYTFDYFLDEITDSSSKDEVHPTILRLTYFANSQVFEFDGDDVTYSSVVTIEKSESQVIASYLGSSFFSPKKESIGPSFFGSVDPYSLLSHEHSALVSFHFPKEAKRYCVTYSLSVYYQEEYTLKQWQKSFDGIFFSSNNSDSVLTFEADYVSDMKLLRNAFMDGYCYTYAMLKQ
jgi:transcriptional regulator with XRE-family HTH domain